MNKRAHKRDLGFCQCLQLIIDEQGETGRVMRQMDEHYRQGRVSVRRSAAYGDQQRRVAALMGTVRRSEIIYTQSEQL
ncbi:hypothetical protein T4A_7683 [Trichinella pseudospiralis]|uniref:Uncharacterized protein n=1 Tax=Trichinella pseudospiralis TaxID=6337 RepID=A0A0V1EQK4_TRIPS|nr:hypothetical protein T4A_7683 [Trichinella pseudospiralis]